MAYAKINPRKTALDMISRYFASGGQLREIIWDGLENSGLEDLDRRFVFSLVKGTVRYYLRSDFLISCLSKRSIEKIDPSILNILRMGAYQAHFMDSVPAYSAVDESVRLAKRPAAGFVNAVMRRLTEIDEPEGFIKKKLMQEGAAGEDMISVLYSFPGWITGYWIKHFGRDGAERICKSLNRVPVFYIWSNLRRYMAAGGDASRESMDKELKSMGAASLDIDREKAEALDPGLKKVFLPLAENRGRDNMDLFGESAMIDSTMDLKAQKLFRKGIISVQDLSSQMAVKYFLDPRPGEKILDCCAAPGGKTSFASLLMEDTGMIAAVDKSMQKIGLLEENIDRLGISNARIIAADASSPGFLEKYPENFFDRIMVDAPCTALGTIAKNPEAKYNRSYDDVERLSELSVKIMSACHPYLRPGGRMMFYTCTISPVENGSAVRRFISLMKHDYTIAKAGSMEMELQMMPYYLDSEGGYACILEKKR
jgi:16S rRNA (cytosine967-C5)-methyltransferase